MLLHNFQNARGASSLFQIRMHFAHFEVGTQIQIQMSNKFKVVRGEIETEKMKIYDYLFLVCPNLQKNMKKHDLA